MKKVSLKEFTVFKNLNDFKFLPIQNFSEQLFTNHTFRNKIEVLVSNEPLTLELIKVFKALEELNKGQLYIIQKSNDNSYFVVGLMQI